MKYVIVTGGVTSSLGKGVVSASIGRLLKAKGYNVLLQKFDPYLNVNPGTLSPKQHGEIFVTEDGAEADLDLGHYERFVDINLTKTSDITTGQIYQTILEKERRGDYLGSTVQVIPHVTNEIKRRLCHEDNNVDIVITEIGGTVGDIEGLPFLEAVRQLKNEVGMNNIVYVHVTLVPTVISEVKTKPTQHSVKELRSIGIQPDILVCRTAGYGCLTDDMKEKLSLFCNVEKDAVFENHNVTTIYELPKLLHEQGLDTVLLKKLNLPNRDSNLGVWNDIGSRIRNLYPSTKRIGIIGEFIELHDAYISINEALKHSFLAVGESMEVEMISPKEIEEWGIAEEVLDHLDGIIIAGDFNEHGMQGKISAVSWTRKRQEPCLGINDGFYAMVLEAVKEKLFLDDRDSAKDYIGTVFLNMGNIRLGSYQSSVSLNSNTGKAYNSAVIKERCRCYLDINNNIIDIIQQDGLKKVGTLLQSGNVTCIIERKEHPWFVGCQFHPEFKSRPDRPHPLITNFVKAIQDNRS